MSCLVALLFYLTLLVSPVQGAYHLETSRQSTAASNPQPFYVELPLDHFGYNNTTFQNRFYVNDQFYEGDGPIFFVDGGEINATLSLGLIFPGQGYTAILDLAERFRALLILWEHRYYGGSLPEFLSGSPITPDSLANYYQYLTFEQALEDVAVFAKNFSLPSHPKQDLRPNSTPWVFLGGSYPGNRAAWMRLRNPEVIFASLSSSAPIETQESFWQYWVAAERALSDSPQYASCLIDAHEFANWVTQVVDQEDVAAAEAFLSVASPANYSQSEANTASAWLGRMIAFDEVFTASMGKFQDYGLNGGLGDFCNNLKSSNYTNDANATAMDLAGGIFAYYGTDHALTIYASVIGNILREGNGATDNPRMSRRSLKSMNGQLSTSIDMDQTSWQWQTCTEAGYFQVSNPSRPTNLVPGFIDLEWWIQEYCVNRFGKRVADGPDVNATNAKYGGWYINTTNVFYTNGQYDPWRALSVASDIDASIPGRVLTTDIPAAGKLSPNGKLFGYVIPNGLHSSDLVYNVSAVSTNTTSTASDFGKGAQVAHEVFASALSSWLPSYTKFAAVPTQASKTVSVPISTATAAAAGTGTETGTGMAPPASTSSKKSGSGATERVWDSAWALTVVALAMAMALLG